MCCKLIRCLFLSVAVLSCQKPLFDSPPRSRYHSEPSPLRDSASVPPGAEEPPPLPDLYASAVCFTDPAQDSSGVQLLLFKNGEELLRIPVNGRTQADRHRIVAGRLWHDESDGETTAVFCNGEPCFRFIGDELLRGFLVDGERVYTLGQRQGRKGLCFRLNGEERFSAPTGTVLGGPDDAEWEGGAFSRDSSGLWYTYGLALWKGLSLTWEYRIMRDETLVQIVPAANTLYDVRVMDGVVYRSELHSRAWCLVKNETYLNVLLKSRETPHLRKLVPVRGEMLLKGYSTGVYGNAKSVFWLRRADDYQHLVVEDSPVADLRADGEHLAYLTEEADGHIGRLMLDDSVAVRFPSGRYRLSGNRCFQLKDGMPGVALTATDGAHHLLVRGRDTLQVHFYGYFTSVQIH